MKPALIAQAKVILPGALLAIVAAAMTLTDAYATANEDEVALQVAASTPCAAGAPAGATTDARHASPADRVEHGARHTCIAAAKG